jgi:1-acyl-sn-glycerol-3-phosphate acyltransferase
VNTGPGPEASGQGPAVPQAEPVQTEPPHAEQAHGEQAHGEQARSRLNGATSQPGMAPPAPAGVPTPFGGAPLVPDRLAVAWFMVARAVVHALARLVWRYRVVGRENLPQTTPYVIAPSHRSYIDTPLVGCIARRRVRFMAKSGVFDSPAAAKLFGSLGGFPVRRGTPDRDALRRCEEALAGGEPVVLFAEGKRCSGPLLGELLDGPAFVAARANMPIVPVGVGGTEKIMGLGVRFPRQGRVVLVVGRPIWPPPPPANGRVPRRAIQELTTRLRAELQAVFDQARELAEQQEGSNGALEKR